MCYSAESSILSFLIGFPACLYLLQSKNNTNKHVGLFLLSVVMMQFLEFLMWIDQKCGFLNSFASRSIGLVLYLQIYTIFLGGYLYNTLIIPKNILKLIFFYLTSHHSVYTKFNLNLNLSFCVFFFFLVVLEPATVIIIIIIIIYY